MVRNQSAFTTVCALLAHLRFTVDVDIEELSLHGVKFLPVVSLVGPFVV